MPGNGFYLRADMNYRTSWWYEPGFGDQFFGWGCSTCGDRPIAGDWNGDELASIGLYNPCSMWWSLKDSQQGLGSPDLRHSWGGCGFSTPLRGNWNGGY